MRDVAIMRSVYHRVLEGVSGGPCAAISARETRRGPARRACAGARRTRAAGPSRRPDHERRVALAKSVKACANKICNRSAKLRACSIARD